MVCNMNASLEVAIWSLIGDISLTETDKVHTLWPEVNIIQMQSSHSQHVSRGNRWRGQT